MDNLLLIKLVAVILSFFFIYGIFKFITGILKLVLIGVFVLIALYSVYGITIDLGPTMNEFIKTCSEFIDNYFKNNAIFEAAKVLMKWRR